MASYHTDNISLSEAMTMELPHITRVWDVSGLKVPCKEIPENARVDKTFVMKFFDGNTIVGVEYTVGSGNSICMKSVANFSQLELEKLQKEFPDLFDIAGKLYAFGGE